MDSLTESPLSTLHAAELSDSSSLVAGRTAHALARRRGRRPAASLLFTLKSFSASPNLFPCPLRLFLSVAHTLLPLFACDRCALTGLRLVFVPLPRCGQKRMKREGCRAGAKKELTDLGTMSARCADCAHTLIHADRLLKQKNNVNGHLVRPGTTSPQRLH